MHHDVAVLDDLVNRQCGVIARFQALGSGVSVSAIRARLRSGRWQRLLPGVYATFSGPVPRLARLWAVQLWAGPGAVLSHETAAELAGFADRPMSVVHVTVPASRTISARPGIVVHRARGIARLRHPGRLPPQTRVEETVLDLTQSAVALEDAYGWIARAVNARLTTADRVRFALTNRPRVRRRRLLEEGLGAVAEGCRSVLEMSYLRDVERAHGLPRAQRQVTVQRRGGKNYIDVRYGRYATRVELDGMAAHPPGHRFRDMRRDNAGVAAGDTPLRYGTADVVTRPCEVAAQVGAVLRGNGWRGELRRCQRATCTADRVGSVSLQRP